MWRNLGALTAVFMDVEDFHFHRNPGRRRGRVRLQFELRDVQHVFAFRQYRGCTWTVPDWRFALGRWLTGCGQRCWDWFRSIFENCGSDSLSWLNECSCLVPR